MPLSKDKQAEYMRNYRAEKRSLGITHRNIRGFTNPVIPKVVDGNKIVGAGISSGLSHGLGVQPTAPEDSPFKKVSLETGETVMVDADGYPVYDE